MHRRHVGRAHGRDVSADVELVLIGCFLSPVAGLAAHAALRATVLNKRRMLTDRFMMSAGVAREVLCLLSVVGIDVAADRVR